MSVVRKVRAEEIDSLARIAANAYPVLKVNSTDELQRYRERLEQGLQGSRI